MPSQFDVSIVIPTLRADDDLLTCLDSIASQEDAPVNEVVVVLNCPDTGSLDLKSHHPNARIVQNESNLGFAAACNIGATQSVGEILVLLNDDMVAQPGWLADLVKPISDGNSAAAGGRILSGSGKEIDFDGSSINLLGWGFQKGLGEKVRQDDNEFSTKNRIPFGCGGNFAIRTELFESLGGFDDEYFAYYEDVDLGWRLGLAGEGILFCRDAVVHHNSGTTGSMMAPQIKWFLQERNALQNVIKNYSDELLGKILPVAMSLVAVRAQILSGLEPADIFEDKFWRTSILGDDVDSAKGSGGLLKGIVDGVKVTLKSGMKNTRKGSLPDGYLPIESRGAAGLYALEWCMNNWDGLFEKRNKVQAMRSKNDIEVLNLFDDPMRPVLGHPREVESMKPLESVLNELMS